MSFLVVEEGRVVEGLGFEVVVGLASSGLLEEEEERYLSVSVVGDIIEDSMEAEVGRAEVSFAVVAVDSGWEMSSTCSGGSGGWLAVGRDG